MSTIWDAILVSQLPNVARNKMKDVDFDIVILSSIHGLNKNVKVKMMQDQWCSSSYSL